MSATEAAAVAATKTAAHASATKAATAETTAVAASATARETIGDGEPRQESGARNRGDHHLARHGMLLGTRAARPLSLCRTGRLKCEQSNRYIDRRPNQGASRLPSQSCRCLFIIALIRRVARPGRERRGEKSSHADSAAILSQTRQFLEHECDDRTYIHVASIHFKKDGLS
jgi:hypothetical protein